VIDVTLEPVDFEALEDQFRPIHIFEWRHRATFCGAPSHEPPHSCPSSRIGLRSETPTFCPTCGRHVCPTCVERRRQQRGR
jgi:hypothetical protein